MDKVNALATATRPGKKGEVKFNGTIENARKGKGRGGGWAKNDCRQALIEGSRYQFEAVVAPALGIPIDSPTKSLKLGILKQRVERNEICVSIEHKPTITQKIFTEDSRQRILKYLLELEEKGEQSISVKNLLKAIEQLNLHTDRITDRNWRNFLDCKKIDRDIFMVFCSILNINYDDVADVPPEPQGKDLTKETRLVEVLTTFNHQAQKNTVCAKAAHKDAPKAFLVVNPCSYSRTWMLRRIEYEIKIVSQRGVEIEQFLSSSNFLPLSIEDLDSLFNKKFVNLELINKKLQTKYLFFIVNIDNYDLAKLNNLVEKFWQPILNKVNPQNPGKILLFLVSSGQGNDWQTEWQNSSILAKSIVELPPAQPDVNDLSEIIPRVAMRLNIQLAEDLTIFSQQLLNESKGSTQKLLQLFYQKFQCKPKQFNQQWQNYPPT